MHRYSTEAIKTQCNSNPHQCSNGYLLMPQSLSLEQATYSPRSGSLTPKGGGARALVCPGWVDNQQIAELYGVWMLLKLAVPRQLPQVLMLKDNTAAIWASVNLRSRAPLRKQNRILRAIVLQLRRAGIILHSAYLPSVYQPAYPISRLPYFSMRCLALAESHAQQRWDMLTRNLHYIEYKGASFLSA